MRKKMGAGGRKREGGQLYKKGGAAGHRLAAACAPCPIRPHSNFFYFFSFFRGLLRNFLAFWENGCTTLPFLKHAPTVGSVKSSICQGDWRFHYFQILFFTKFRIYLDLHIYCWDFCFTKIEITKNSSRFASVMEIFCTLLQCRVHLSMFHSSSTSKIWPTST
jgi:hypothetical protein